MRIYPDKEKSIIHTCIAGGIFKKKIIYFCNSIEFSILSHRQIGSVFLSHAVLCQGRKVHPCFTKLWGSRLGGMKKKKKEKRKADENNPFSAEVVGGHQDILVTHLHNILLQCAKKK